MDTSTPSTQTFHFEGGGIGDLSKSVNLFRGDVNYHQTLLKLRDRPGRSELAVDLSIVYQSNVQDIVTGRNLEAPTGVLGVGWELPLERIVLDPGGTASPATRRYYLQSGAISTRLVRQSAAYRQPRLITTEIVAQDLAGPGISANLQQVFAAHGIALSRQGGIAPDGAATWTLTDAGNERLFALTVSGPQVTVHDGGESYQPQSYQFWHVTYYPPFERWEIVKENGVASSYGGGLDTTARGYRTSRGNSVRWSVRWGNWLGDSSVTDGQQQYASAWYLSELRNRWGDAVGYAYNGWERNAATGLIPDVEQVVGHGRTTGKPFTRAVYLTRITDVFGRTVTLNYADKVYSHPVSDPAGPREYQDPHKPVANDGAPNSFQDPLETKYLDTITTTTASGRLLFTIALAYTKTLVNVTRNTGQLHGDTCKRYLQSITRFTAEGDSEPGLAFDYYADPADINAGALRSITYPSGGVATYRFTENKNGLAICSRRQPVSASGKDRNWTPRIFFGSDYAVTLWYDNTAGQLAMTVYTWIGRWQAWQPAQGIVYRNVLGLNPDTLQVLPGEEHFVLSFSASTQDGRRTYVHLYHKDPREMGQWVPLDDGGSAALVFDIEGATVQLATGGAFLVAVRFRDQDNSYAVTRCTWDWTIRNWRVEKDVTSGSSSGVCVTAGQEYYLLLAYTLNQPRARVRLAWVDPLGDWHEGAPLADDLTVYRSDWIFLTPGSTMVAVGTLDQPSPTLPRHSLSIYRWDEHYTPARSFAKSFTQRVRRGGHPASIVPQISGDRLVLCGENVAVFDGAAWQLNQSLVIENPPAGGQDPWYAVGEGYVIRTIPSISQFMPPSCRLLTYDPDTDTARWSAKALIEPKPALQYRQQNPNTANFSTASGSGYFTSDRHLYARGQTPDWSAGAQAPLFAMPDNLDTKAILNQSPHFVAYAVPNQELAKSVTQVLILKNGTVSDTETLTGEKYWTLDERTSGNGRYPAGPASLVSYDATLASFDQAQSYTLYRFAGDSITKNLTHHPVASISVTDGFGEVQETAYAFDPGSAACDNSGKVVKYYKSTTYHGCAEPGASRAGRVETFYINGHRGGDTSPYFYMLDGMIDKIMSYDGDGKLVASDRQTWTVYTARNRSPRVKDATPLALNGTYTKLTARETWKDGVATTAGHSYLPAGFDAPYSGQVLETATTIHNTRAVPETHLKTTRYGCEVYADLAAQNLLSAVVQTTQSVSVNGAAPVVTQARVTTYVSWPAAAGADIVRVMDVADEYHWRGGGAVEFPFGAKPDGALWLRKNSMVARTSRGLVAEIRDALNVPQSALYDSSQEFTVASFGNTSLSGDEGRYCGFEPYADQRGWTVHGSAALLAGDAHTGAHSLQLPARGGAALSTALTPARHAQRYILGWWYKTGRGFQADARSGWSIRVTAAGAPVGQAVEAPFKDTGGIWSYACQVIDLGAYRAQPPLTMEFTASNSAAMPVLLDDVSISPFPASVTGSTHDTDFALVVAETHLGGKTRRFLHDHLRRKLVDVDAGGQVASLTTQYASRRGNDDRFESRDPNSLVHIKARDGGSCDQFQTGDEWRTRWSPGGTWQAADGALNNSGAATLSAVGLSANFALLLELTPRAAVTDNIGLHLGAGTALQWQASAKQWALTVAGRSVAALAQPGLVARQWLLIGGDRSLLFFADGRLVFGHVHAAAPVRSLQLSTGANSVSLRKLTLIRDPVVNVTYHDAAGRKRQSQALLDDDTLVAQTIHDRLGKQVAVTKQAPGSFGGGARLPLMAYRATFADVAGFLARFDTDGIMQGDVADYYRGQIEPVSGLPRSDDAGYPYTRIRHEASPLGREIERGLPGKDSAIIGSGSARHNTEQIAYGAGASGAIPGESGSDTDSYFVETHVTPPNNAENQPLSRRVVRDKANQEIVNATRMTTGVDEFLYATTALTYRPSGTEIVARLPNYYSKLGADREKFVSTHVRDPLGRYVLRTEPDMQPNRAVYDSAGRLRFSEADQAAPPADRAITYRKYDALGRAIEAGTYPYDWNDATDVALRALADQPLWPPATATIQTVIEHDGDGSDPNAIGHPTRVVQTNAEAGAHGLAATVSETFGYDGAGRIARRTLSVSGAAGANRALEVAFAHDGLGNVTEIIYPRADATGVSRVCYSFDRLGRVVGIGASPADPISYASYAYDAAGKRIAAGFNNDRLRALASFTSRGALSTSLASAANGLATRSVHQYWPDGSLREIATSRSGAGESDQNTCQFAYDSSHRLLAARNSTHTDWDLTAAQYDANGNLLSLQQGGQTETFAHAPGTNQLAALRYDSHGRVRSTPKLRLRYQPGTGRTSRIEVVASGDTVALGYNGQGQRVSKQVLNRSGVAVSSRLYVRGMHALPILEVDQDGSAVAYIYGPDGLVAMKAARLCFPLKDRQGSIRQVFDSAGALVAGYDYLPFGGIARRYGPQPDLMRYLYTGQELDPETGLYNYRARLYDCALCRFYSPDPKRQFPSPYVYAGNNPIMGIDPTGMLSFWEIFSDIAHFFVDVGLIVGGLLVMAGTVFGAGPIATIVGSTLLGAGISGLVYDISTLAKHQQVDWKAWGIQLGIGAATGLLAGGLAAGASVAVEAGVQAGIETFTVGGFGRIATNVISGTLGNTGIGAFGTFLNNVATGQAYATGVGFSALMGGLFAFLGSAASEALAGGFLAETVVDRPSVFDARVNEVYEDMYGENDALRGDFWARMSKRSEIGETLSKETTVLESSVKNNLILTLPGSLFSAIYTGIETIPTIPKW